MRGEYSLLCVKFSSSVRSTSFPINLKIFIPDSQSPYCWWLCFWKLKEMVTALLKESDMELADEVIEDIVNKVLNTPQLLVQYFCHSLQIMLTCYLVCTDNGRSRFKWRWKDWYRRMEAICCKEPIHSKEHDSSVFKVKSFESEKHYDTGTSVLLIVFALILQRNNFTVSKLCVELYCSWLDMISHSWTVINLSLLSKCMTSSVKWNFPPGSLNASWQD